VELMLTAWLGEEAGLVGGLISAGLGGGKLRHQDMPSLKSR
jgi:hypothetical protein